MVPPAISALRLARRYALLRALLKEAACTCPVPVGFTPGEVSGPSVDFGLTLGFPPNDRPVADISKPGGDGNWDPSS